MDVAEPRSFTGVQMRVILGYLTIIRWSLTLKVGIVTYRFSPELSDWFCELSGLNDAIVAARAVREIPDRREAKAEPLPALYVKTH